MGKKPEIIYGGPYAVESDAITLESAKEKPDYDGLISGWKSISQGAYDYIQSLKEPVEVSGPFVENVKEAENEDTPSEDTSGQTEVDLDKL